VDFYHKYMFQWSFELIKLVNMLVSDF
jgi:hypothetical protein